MRFSSHFLRHCDRSRVFIARSVLFLKNDMLLTWRLEVAKNQHIYQAVELQNVCSERRWPNGFNRKPRRDALFPYFLTKSRSLQWKICSRGMANALY